jgi:hypothetical protein
MGKYYVSGTVSTSGIKSLFFQKLLYFFREPSVGIFHFDIMKKAAVLAVAKAFSLPGLFNDYPTVEASGLASDQRVVAIRFNAF